MDDQHITAERMLEVATECNALLTDAEQQHIGLCRKCLHAFSFIVLEEREYVRRRIQEMK